MGSGSTEHQRSQIKKMCTRHRQPLRNGNGQDQNPFRSPHPTWLPHSPAGKTTDAAIPIWLSARILWCEWFRIHRDGYRFCLPELSWQTTRRYCQTEQETRAPLREDGAMPWFWLLVRGWILSSGMLSETQSVQQKNSRTVQSGSPWQSNDRPLL